MSTEKKKTKVNPYLVGGVILIGGALYFLSEPTAAEKAAGLEGLGNLRDRLRRIREHLTPKFVKHAVQEIPKPKAAEKIIAKLQPKPGMPVKAVVISKPSIFSRPISTPPVVKENPADYYGGLYNHRP